MTSADVMLWGTRIGTVTFDPAVGLGSFEYDRTFLRSGIELSPIHMPLSQQTYRFPELPRVSFHGLPGLLSDSLPDKFGNAIIDAWLASQGRSSDSFDPVERLCYTGSRGMGALEYIPARGPSALESERVHLDKLVELANEILSSRQDLRFQVTDNTMQELIRVGTSAGGARAKAIIAWNEQIGDIRSGQIDAGEGYDYWLIKFDGIENNRDKENADAPQHTKIEYAYYQMAVDAGIDMTECRLYEESGRFHFMTLRFDRRRGTGDKIHMQTLGSIAHADFNAPGTFSYEDAAQIMRQMNLTKTEIIQLFRRMTFNVAARNQDDHVKNISFLMDRRGQWSLAPAYDMTYAYNPGGMWTGSHQMRIHGKQDQITYSDLLASARSMGLTKADADAAIRDVKAAVSNWNRYAEQAQIRESVAERIAGQFVSI